MSTAALQSRVYECVVHHARFSPRPHAFTYRLFYLALALDELPELARRLRLLGVNRAGCASLRESDYFPVQESVHNPTRGTDRLPAAAPGLQARVLS